MTAPRYVSALDLGQAADYCALVVLEQSRAPLPGPDGRRGWHFTVRHIERWELGTPYGAVCKAVATRFDLPALAGSRLGVDFTGVGRPVFEQLAAARPRAALHPILFTSGHAVTREPIANWPGNPAWHVPKRVLAVTLQLHVDARTFTCDARLPLADELAKELKAFKVKITAAANETFDAPDGQHDDLCMAAAMAVWLGARTGLGDPAGITVPTGEDACLALAAPEELR